MLGKGEKWWYRNMGGGFAEWWSGLSEEERERYRIEDPEGKKVLPVAVALGLIENQGWGAGWLPPYVSLKGDWQLK